jgi:DNA gyrase/topoisomerase IV subunit B
MRTLLFALMLLFGAAGGQLRAADAADPDLPQPVSPDDLTALITSSPFTRSLNLSDSLVLTGIAYDEGKPMVTLVNKETKETYFVTQDTNPQGMRLAEITPTIQLNRSQAKIMIGTEIVTVRYSDQQLTPEAMKKGGFKPGGGTPGGPPDGSGARPSDGPRREYPRPSQEDIDRFKNLSDKAREEFIQKMRDSRDRMMSATPEERQAYAKKMMEKVESDDKERRR